jgi:hypothetical protein
LCVRALLHEHRVLIEVLKRGEVKRAERLIVVASPVQTEKGLSLDGELHAM